MKKTFFTPGPTELYPEVRQYISDALEKNICSINHRNKDFMDIYKFTVDSLKQLLNIPGTHHVFFLASATECMDRIIQNLVEKECLHFVNGAFAERFYKTAVELNKDAQKIEVAYGEGFDFENSILTGNPELIAFTQNETSTGVAIDPAHIYDFRKIFPEAIIAVDIVTSAPYVNLDFTKIDCAFFSVQKGFGMPAGLGVLIVHEKCIDKAVQLKSKTNQIGSYHNFVSLFENAVKYQTTETPNVLGIYLLGRVAAHLNKTGIEKIRRETETKANLLYEFLDGNDSFTAFVKKKSDRSKTIVVIEAGDLQKEIKELLADNGYIAGSGYGRFRDSQIRIANFPMHRIDDVQKIIKILSRIKVNFTN